MPGDEHAGVQVCWGHFFIPKSMAEIGFHKADCLGRETSQIPLPIGVFLLFRPAVDSAHYDLTVSVVTRDQHSLTTMY